MEEEIAEFKRKNGNSSFSQKEMTMYLIQRVDSISDRLEKGSGKIGCNKARIKSVVSVLRVGTLILCTILGYLFVVTVNCCK